MNTTEALDIHSNPDGNTGARWREARAVLEAAVKDAAEMQATRREALAAAAMIRRLASVKPTVYLTNWSSRRLHGPGRPLTIMAVPRAWEHGMGSVGILLPDRGALRMVKAGTMPIDRYLADFRADLAHVASGTPNPFAPGHLMYRPGMSFPELAVFDGDTLLCACKVGAPCHRREAAPFLVRAGWRVILDGVEVVNV